MKKIINVITTIIMAVVVILACIFFAPRVFGITPMAVLSGSMEPTFHVGSLVFVKNAELSEVAVGDPITFKMADGETLVTHRAIEVTDEGIKTQGDANESEDGGLVNQSNFVGKAFEFSIPFMGYLAVYMNTKSGIIILVAIVIASLLLSYLPDLFEKKSESEEEGKPNDKKSKS